MTSQRTAWSSGDDSERLRVDSVRSLNNEDVVWNAGKIQLEPARMFGQAVVQEVGQTIGTHWIREMTNLNQRTITTSLLMFITVVIPVITFGAFYGHATNNNIGTVETIMATAAVGIVYPLIGGMPLVRKRMKTRRSKIPPPFVVVVVSHGRCVFFFSLLF
jgi:HCO3- transporter family